LLFICSYHRIVNNMNKSSLFVGQHIFSQILSLSSKASLSPVFEKTSANKWYKSTMAWDHFVSMMFCVFANCTSLREIVAGLEAFGGKLNHLNLEKVPPRSTLSDANKARPSSIFGEIYNDLNRRYSLNLSDSTLPKVVLSRLFLIDSTVFSLFKAILKTSGRTPTDSKRKGGIKKNTMLDANSLMPVLVRFNAAADNDQQFLKYIELPTGSYITFDKGYNNYKCFARFSQNGVFFITRQKDNAVYTTVAEAILTKDTPDAVLKEETIEQTYKDENGKEQTLQLRRIAWWDTDGSRVYEFITNNFELGAATIAAIYKYRWRIELFFKKLKQNFPLQYFVGDNQNAIEIQIWCALIAVLLLTVIHEHNNASLSFSNVTTLMRIHLAGYISIKELLALHNQKRERNKKAAHQKDLFSSA
ncbi:IS4 family transposase, partial [Parasediminibacterium sp. JCM 36343]|uniref:IS4 family transposase n=1 Tax=Parasediminibacterium sp. JCM 36343 TaxID=3374279 RepID=UPI00397C2DB7